jgi:RNA polymerase sigma factor (sigma-70 family)
MATSPLNPVLDQLRRALLLRDGGDQPDGQLLESFISQKDEAAFEALVRRHGPMVLGVCRRVLRNHHDAEDAFQATFLVLVRKAGSILPREKVAHWLHGVACRTALKARTTIVRQRVREKQVTELPEPETAGPESHGGDWQPLLDQELSRLPDKYRVPIILCDLEGKTGKDAARQLGWPEGTVASRLSRGREMLAKRLTRYGLVLAGESLAAVLRPNAASAGVPTSLLSSTVKAASFLAAGQALTTGLVSAKVAALTEGVLRTMFLSKLKIALVLCALIGVVGTGLGGLFFRVVAGDQPALPGGQQQAAQADEKKAPEKNQAREALDLVLKGYRAYWDAQGKKAADKKTGRNEAAAIVRVPGVYTTAVGLTANGKFLATGGSDNTVRVWDVGSGKELHTLKGHTAAINCLTFFPDGKTLASATGDWVKESAPGEVKLWDVATGKERAAVKGHRGFVMSLAFSADGKSLASASDTVKVWDVATGKEQSEIPGPGTAIAFSPDNTLLAVGRGVREDDTPGWVELWDRTGKQRAKLPGHVGMVACVGFSPDGKTLASTDAKGTLKLWDAATGKERFSIRHPDGSFFLQPLAFTADGKQLLAMMRLNTGEGDGAIIVKAWEVDSGKELATYGLPSDKGGFFTAFTAFSADARSLAIGGFERLDQGKRPQSEWKINGVTAVWEVKSLALVAREKR